ncbi:thioredoxin-disulfide reductase [Timonella senegalensis]|uniref:thioredoxin-disulfide reductase n=1 Tax=Timonella senegalensis TaxID=1465825 RepID=UPI0028A60583|nr:thioredoxin-disulfide reductase [Timonella senegalensis]
MSILNVVVVGSGPAGYTAALYAARARLSPVVLAGSVTAGGSLMNTTEVENFPGHPQGVMGPELMESMRVQAERFGADVRFDDVVEMNLDQDIKTLRTATGDILHTKSVILALGSEYRKLGLPNEDRLTGRGVSWCATCDGFFFREQQVAVVGGGDSAMEEALFLTQFASRVTVIHRRGELRASKIMADRVLAHPKITVAYWNEVAEIIGQDRVEALSLRDVRTGESQLLDAAGLFVAIGHDPRTDVVSDEVTLDSEGYIIVNSPNTQTSVPGVFAAGDVVDKHYRQAITAAGTGCAAALDAQRYLTANSSAPVLEVRA